MAKIHMPESTALKSESTSSPWPCSINSVLLARPSHTPPHPDHSLRTSNRDDSPCSGAILIAAGSPKDRAREGERVSSGVALIAKPCLVGLQSHLRTPRLRTGMSVYKPPPPRTSERSLLPHTILHTTPHSQPSSISSLTLTLNRSRYHEHIPLNRLPHEYTMASISSITPFMPSTFDDVCEDFRSVPCAPPCTRSPSPAPSMRCSASTDSMADLNLHALDGQSFMKALREAHMKCFQNGTGSERS